MSGRQARVVTTANDAAPYTQSDTPLLPSEPGVPLRLVPRGEIGAGADVERELLALRRARISVILNGPWRLTLLTILLAIGIAMVAGGRASAVGLRVSVAAGVGVLLVLTWEAIKRDAHRYCLTDRRLLWRFGVLRRVMIDVPLERIQNVVVAQPLVERVLGLGTIRVSTAASDGVDIVMRFILDPHRVSRVLEEARYARTIAAARGDSSMPVNYPTAAPDQTTSMPVIGIVGGIGAGKSTAAKAFQRLGCHVVDSDTRAREALDRPEVRDRLVQWWGADILTPSGRVDRAKVGSIVFALPGERERLEAVVHPIVRQDRARMIEDAARFWARGVIVDAPLLFEAGVDTECDAVIFVDAPREVRLSRVRSTRGWSEAEFDRREGAQMSLEEKRSRCQYVISNAGDENLDAQAERILADLRRKHA